MKYIGIDPGSITGYAIWDRTQTCFLEIGSFPGWQIFTKMDEWDRDSCWAELAIAQKNDTRTPEQIRQGVPIMRYEPPYKLIIEDARLNKMPRHLQNQHKAQGAGAVKWFCGQIELACEQMGYPYQMVRAQASKRQWLHTKMSQEEFMTRTGWTEPTNQHGRDAAALVYGH